MGLGKTLQVRDHNWKGFSCWFRMYPDPLTVRIHQAKCERCVLSEYLFSHADNHPQVLTTRTSSFAHSQCFPPGKWLAASIHPPGAWNPNHRITGSNSVATFLQDHSLSRSCHRTWTPQKLPSRRPRLRYYDYYIRIVHRRGCLVQEPTVDVLCPRRRS